VNHDDPRPELLEHRRDRHVLQKPRQRRIPAETFALTAIAYP
jgi:hypothetical protein